MKKKSVHTNKLSQPLHHQPEGLSLYILKNSEKVIIDRGMCIFIITSVSVHFQILAQMKCLKVI